MQHLSSSRATLLSTDTCNFPGPLPNPLLVSYIVEVQTLPERAWFAYNCLPRARNGGLPPVKPLELAHGLSNRTLHKIFSGATVDPGGKTLVGVSNALEVSIDWLLKGVGKAPTLVSPMVPLDGWLQKQSDPIAPRLEARVREAKNGSKKRARAR